VPRTKNSVMVQSRLTWALVIAAYALPAIPVQAVDVSVPTSPPNNVTVVKSNFLGVSFELSAFDKYCEFHPNSRPMTGGRVLTLRISTRAVMKSVRMRPE